MSETVTDNTALKRFELSIAGQIAWADYHTEGTTLYVDHVEAPLALRGTGAAGRLMEGIMHAAAASGQAVVPVCSYAATWMRRHRAL